MSLKTKLRWGILGAARVNERLLPAIIEADNASLIAIASRRQSAALQTLEQYAPNQKRKSGRCVRGDESLSTDARFTDTSRLPANDRC